MEGSTLAVIIILVLLLVYLFHFGYLKFLSEYIPKVVPDKNTGGSTPSPTGTAVGTPSTPAPSTSTSVTTSTSTSSSTSNSASVTTGISTSATPATPASSGSPTVPATSSVNSRSYDYTDGYPLAGPSMMLGGVGAYKSWNQCQADCDAKAGCNAFYYVPIGSGGNCYWQDTATPSIFSTGMMGARAGILKK